MPKLRAILAAFSFMIFAVVVAHAQGAIVISVQAGQGRGAGIGNGNGNGTGIGAVSGMIGSFMSSGISGTPFSADVVEESDRFLADGNHIHHENHGRIFRDSQGRARNENELGPFGPGTKPFVHIMISDPVERRFILLNPEQKTATITQFGIHLAGRAGITPAQPANNAGKPDAPATAAAEPGATRATSAMRAPGNMKIAREDLGTRVIEGYTVTGTRYTHTIPAGEIGNDQPMTTANERWFSSDLKMDLLYKSESPEAGKHVYKLVNIRLGDPDPLLFQAPADYTVKETPQQQ